jgi:hypothetical protein
MPLGIFKKLQNNGSNMKCTGETTTQENDLYVFTGE